MKNLLDPKLLARFQERPTPTNEIVDFLDTHPDISTVNLCRIIEISPSQIYNYRANLKRKPNNVEENDDSVESKSSSKSFNRYTAEEKFSLLENYLKADDQGKAKLLRKYGLYDSDIKRWRDQVKNASLEVLGKRKQRSDKKSEDQIEIERLQQELQEQEKTTAKLSTLLVLQKNFRYAKKERLNLNIEEKKELLKTAQEAIDAGITIEKFCDSVGVPTRSYFLWKKTSNKIEIKKKGRKTSPENKLSFKEKEEIVNVLLKKEWADYSPREIYYKLIDEEKRIIASPATFYRIAKDADLLTKRSKTGIKRPLNREKPQLVATGHNQVWSWDVSQIKSECRSVRFYLYVIVDIWSRLVVGWVLEDHEKSEHAIIMWKKGKSSQLYVF